MTVASLVTTSALCCVVGASTASAAPTDTLTYHFTSCTGPAGTPAQFDAIKQPGQAAALRWVDGGVVFVVMEAVDADTGSVLFATPGFAYNGLATVTCDLIHPVTGENTVVTGLFAPVT